MESLIEKQVMDMEWVELIMEALELGLSPREIRDYFQNRRETAMICLEIEREP